MKINVLLADDHQILREGIRNLLEKDPNLIIKGEANNGRMAVEAALELKPDVVIMDISMPEMNGIEATARIHSLNDKIKILALSMHVERQFVSEMINSGASGYVPKDCAPEELICAIHTVMSGQFYMGPGIASVLVEDYRERLARPGGGRADKLTARERESLQLIAEGKSTKEIASALNVSEKTIETYRLQIMKKLNMHSVAQLTKYAIREGMTTLEFC
ncbi:MAG: response regulator transcription factor [Candidatus Sumerlaeia bacterium]